MAKTEGLPRVVVSTPTADLGQEIVHRLAERGYPSVGLRTARTQASAIHYRPGVHFEHVLELMQFLTRLHMNEVRLKAEVGELVGKVMGS